MNLLSLFRRRPSGSVARDRLQILLAHERVLSTEPDLVTILHEEILAVIARHVAINRDQVMVKLDRGEVMSTLEIDIEMPAQIVKAGKKPVPAPSPPANEDKRKEDKANEKPKEGPLTSTVKD